jgi:hypothetical protein
MSFIGKLFGGRTEREKRLDREYENAFLPLVQQGAKQGQEYHALVAPRLAQADATLKPVQDYFSNILQGGQGMMDALSPELSSLSTAHKNISAQSQFAPRGSGQVSRQGELDTQYLKSIGDIIGKARPEAAGQLGSIASLLYNLTTAFASTAQGQTGTIGNLLNQFRAGNMAERNARQEGIGQAMQTLGTFIGL